MKTITLPFEDHDGTLSVHVIAALAAEQCTAERDPNDPDSILLHFAKAADANALVKALKAEPEDAPAIETHNPVEE